MRETPIIDIRRRDERLSTDTHWLRSLHSFSFARHYDRESTHHGLLVVSNDDIVKPGFGFETHPHRDMEIVTWVLEGEIEHTDTVGNKGIIYPGLAQRMSAGSGIRHSEMNPSASKEAHFVQMWVLPDEESIAPSYEQLDINSELEKGGLVPVASGRDEHAAIRLRQKGAVLWAGRLAPGETVNTPDAAYVHMFIAKGGVNLEGAGQLAAGDAVRLTGGSGPAVKAGPEGAEILIWEMAELRTPAWG